MSGGKFVWRLEKKLQAGLSNAANSDVLIANVLTSGGIARLVGILYISAMRISCGEKY